MPFALSPTSIHTFRHALSLDEHRANFKATPWHRPKKQSGDGFEGHVQVVNGQAQLHTTKETKATHVKEVWFAVRSSSKYIESKFIFRIVGLSFRFASFRC